MTVWPDGTSALKAASNVERETRSTGAIYATDFGVRSDGVTPSAAGMVAALAAADAGAYGTVFVPGGQKNSTIGRIKMEAGAIEIPDGVKIVGTGRRGTTFDAIVGTYPINTPMFKTGTAGLVFDVRLENLSINMNSIAGSECIRFAAIQEGCGLDHVGLYAFKSYGAYIGGQNFALHDLEVYGSAGSTSGVKIAGSPFFTIDWATLNTGNAGTSGYGLELSGCTNANINQIHAEGNLYGVYVASGSINLNAISGNGNDTVVYIHGSSNNVTMRAISMAGTSPTLFNDAKNFVTSTESDIGFYAIDDIRIAGTRILNGSSGASSPSGFGAAGDVKFNTGPAAMPAWVCYSAGNWRPLAMSPTVATLTYSASMTPQAHVAIIHQVTVTNGTAMTMNAPANPSIGMDLTLDILNSSGGAMGAITWNAIYKMAGAFTNPASTKRRTIRFYYDGTSWIEVCRAAADI